MKDSWKSILLAWNARSLLTKHGGFTWVGLDPPECVKKQPCAKSIGALTVDIRPAWFLLRF